MLTCCAVKRLLTVLDRKPRPNGKIKTAVYCSKTADINDLGQYVRRFLIDESYISREKYQFDYDRENVYIEKSDDYSMFKYVIAQNYEIVFMIEGDEDEKLREIVEESAKDDDTVFVPMDCKLRAYKFLDTWNQPRKLKRKEE